MFNSVSRHTFYPKYVSRKIGGGSRVSESKQVVVSSDWREIVEKGLSAITLQTKNLVSGK